METPPHKLQGLKDLVQTFWCQTPLRTFGRVFFLFFFVLAAPPGYIGFHQHEGTLSGQEFMSDHGDKMDASACGSLARVHTHSGLGRGASRGDPPLTVPLPQSASRNRKPEVSSPVGSWGCI